MNDLFGVINQEIEGMLSLDFSMERWVKEWISSASLNEIVASFEDLTVTIHQASHSSEYPILR